VAPAASRKTYTLFSPEEASGVISITLSETPWKSSAWDVATETAKRIAVAVRMSGVIGVASITIQSYDICINHASVHALASGLAHEI
jgi:hypothetical protein